MNNRSLLIYPTDATTAFLSAIIAHIYKHIHSDYFKVLQLDFTDESHLSAIEELKKDEFSTVIFLGHGTVSSLRGSKNESYKNESFITSKNFSVFKGKNVVLVSCESATLLRKNKQDVKSGIGFGDLPTDFNDISAAREVDSRAYEDFSQETINSFQKALINSVKYTLVDYIKSGYDCNLFKKMIVLRINKAIANNYISKVSGYKPLNQSLARIKEELSIVFN